MTSLKQYTFLVNHDLLNVDHYFNCSIIYEKYQAQQMLVRLKSMQRVCLMWKSHKNSFFFYSACTVCKHKSTSARTIWCVSNWQCFIFYWSVVPPNWKSAHITHNATINMVATACMIEKVSNVLEIWCVLSQILWPKVLILAELFHSKIPRICLCVCVCVGGGGGGD